MNPSDVLHFELPLRCSSSSGLGRDIAGATSLASLLAALLLPPSLHSSEETGELALVQL